MIISFTSLLVGIASFHSVTSSPLTSSSSHNSRRGLSYSLTKRANIQFPSDSQCSSVQQDRVKGAYQDALLLADWGQYLLGDTTSGNLGQRYFGDEQASVNNKGRTIQQVAGIVTKASKWYPWWFFDRLFGKRINVSCNDKEGQCKVNAVLAYARSPSDGPLIVFCPPFFDPDSGLFGWPALANRKSVLDRQSEDTKLTCNNYGNRGSVFLHEMIHLKVISGSPHVPDYKADSGYTYYGPYRTERLALKQPWNARNNADNYALYCNAAYFSQFYGRCRVPTSSNGYSATDPTAQDNNDNPFGNLTAPYLFDDGSESDSNIDYGPSGYPESDSEAADLDNMIFSIAHDPAPPGSDYSQPSISGKNLRILPLGDSITQGYQSSDSNGYRQHLYNLLAGNTVDLVGENHSGTMADNAEQGIDGAVIDTIASNAGPSLQLRPNVVLLHAGTNDCGKNEEDGAPARLSSLIDQIFAACPDTVILVAEIIGNTDQTTMGNIVTYNQAVEDMVTERINNGQHVIWVPLGHALPPSQYADGLHPNDEGYATMATYWYQGIIEANAAGLIGDPVPVKGLTGKKAQCTRGGLFWDPQGQVASGAALGAHLYPGISCTSREEDPTQCACQDLSDPNSIAFVETLSGRSCEDMSYPNATAVHFADLDGDGRAEYLWVGPNGEVTAYYNGGYIDDDSKATHIIWVPAGEIASGIGGKRAEIRFADLNGDGRAEYLWVQPNGAVVAYLNLGAGPGAATPANVGWSNQGTIAAGIGFNGAGTRFADIAGVGRSDYLWVSDIGAVYGFLNLGPAIDDGPDAAKVGWSDQGTIADGIGQPRWAVQFADIDGDGRDDYLGVHLDDGSIFEYRNDRAQDKGPHALENIIWDPGNREAIAGGVGSSGQNVILADLNGDGRADYIAIDPDTSAASLWLNRCQQLAT